LLGGDFISRAALTAPVGIVGFRQRFALLNTLERFDFWLGKFLTPEILKEKPLLLLLIISLPKN